MAKHLAIINREAVEAIFDGRKKIEGRFSKIKIAPFGKVSRGDVILMKLPGEDIVGQFTADRVFSFDHPTDLEIAEVKKKYAQDMAMPASFWHEREKINYITLIYIKSVTKFIIAPEVAKRDLRPWVVLE